MEFITQNSTVIILVAGGIIAGIATYWRQIASLFISQGSPALVDQGGKEKSHRDVTNELVEGMYFARSIGNKELQESNYKALKTHFDAGQVTE